MKDDSKPMVLQSLFSLGLDIARSDFCAVPLTFETDKDDNLIMSVVFQKTWYKFSVDGRTNVTRFISKKLMDAKERT